ncbi:hypothetical protein GL213_02885 [Halogeometricum borinquense]|uniref:Uncharacterized protein n=2 Tax=Halogeometricum borinquense TaxID=60847 RepID=A0A6C0UKS0_9EURY|nr:hypothetical protein [Halogeometricum borinquense]QIB75847.1 hypothetical protein G3I44_17130 [Halogeometricum borinquense]QIQ75570.1 hypothetical protein GL213_02885 [Halogeometricum borinquense]
MFIYESLNSGDEVTPDGSTRRSTRPSTHVPYAESLDRQPRSTDTTQMTKHMTRRTTRPMTREYPNDEENMEAPLVPFIIDPTEQTSDNEIRNLRRDIAALRTQLDRIETRMEENQ